MDRLETLQTFVAVVRCSSFTAAADQLGLSRPVVSKHITDLEAHLKVRLLTRTTRSVTPTEAGRRYYDFCTRILSEMQAEEEALTALTSDLEGRVSVVCPKWPGNFDVSEALAAFCRQNPSISVELAIGGAWSTPYEFIEHGYDICLQAGPLRDSRIKVRKVGEVDYILVAAPAYLAARGRPQAPADLLHHDALTQPSEPAWRFLVDGERTALKVSPRFVSNSFPALRKAAMAGLGVAMVPHRIVLGELERGVLERVLDGFLLETTPLYAAYAPDGAPPRKVRALVDFLLDWFRSQAGAANDFAERPDATSAPSLAS